MLTPVVGVVALGGGGGDAGGVGSSRGAAPSRPHGKDSVPPRAPTMKRATDSSEGAKPPAKRRHGVPLEREARPDVPVVPG